MDANLRFPLTYNLISVTAAPQMHVNEQGVNDLSNATHVLLRQRQIIEGDNYSNSGKNILMILRRESGAVN